MDGPRLSGPKRADPVGASHAWRPSVRYLAVALAIIAAGLAVLLMSTPSPTLVLANTADPPLLAAAASSPAPPAPARAASAASSTTPPTPMPATPAAGIAAGAAPQEVSRVRDPNGDLTPDLSDYVNIGERPTMAEVIERLHLAGVYGGLGAFSPPGTRPPLVGLAVPEDFVLPEGYVRHYQATDDGQRIEAILMFSPDTQFFDAAQQPIAIPKDRVVPPELAPPGLPLRRIVVPAPIEPGK
jgi:hypothetical protein